uniref:Uncharacterized protein n=1 Tax=Anolis carolinensis TaxID=28377 RepID=A0A803SSX8_ANOCA
MQRNKIYFSVRSCKGRPLSMTIILKNTLMPQEQFPSGSASLEFHMSNKGGLMKHLRTTVRKMFPFYQKTSKKTMFHSDNPTEPLMPRSAAIPNKHWVLPKIICEFSSPKVFPKLKRKKLSQNGNELPLDVNSVQQHNVEARSMTRMMKRISVVSLSPGIQKVIGNPQTIEKSIQLLALRSAELQQCESLGDKILQFSKQFQKVSLQTKKRHKLKNICFPCNCCC